MISCTYNQLNQVLQVMINTTKQPENTLIQYYKVECNKDLVQYILYNIPTALNDSNVTANFYSITHDATTPLNIDIRVTAVDICNQLSNTIRLTECASGGH